MDTQTKEETKELEKLYAETLHRVERGAITKGRIIAVKSDTVVVDVGYKSEGVIPASEFTESELRSLAEGAEIDVFVERINDEEGVVVLSKDKALKIRCHEKLTAAFNNNEQIEGKITEKTKGGLFVEVMGATAFLPASQVDIKGVKDLDALIGTVVPLKILKLVAQKSQFGQTPGLSIIVSRRAIIEEDKNKKKSETLKVLKEGAILEGTVKNITDYGVFVDLGGIDGLLHISDISWRRVNHPSEFFSVGDKATFLVLKYDEQTQKITLGYKQKITDPWLTVEDRYNVGMKIKGKVVTVADYGLFVEIEDGLEGLVHVSELDWAPRLKHPSKYVAVNDEVEAVVLNISKDERRLSLSIKQLHPKPWELVGKQYKVGDKVTGKIKTVTDFGAFMRLPEGVDGLIHISDLSWTKHIKHPSEELRKGQKVDAVVLSLDPEKERMALGIKQLSSDPWQSEIPAKFKLGSEFQGKVLRITDFGMFVELEGSVEGLVYSSEIDTSLDVKENDEVRVRIIKLNIEDRKIGLSMKNLKTHES
ncbi:MAG: 30S ribosomal protein S1 [Nitrospirae bacterium]|nr:30S ribosomal protein S1 [Nitrospirota bacterium]